MSPSRARARTFTAVRAIISIAVIATLIRQSSWAELTLQLDGRLLLGFGAASVAILAALLFSAIRWKLVLGADGPSVPALWRLYLVGWFFSLFLPTSVGGDAVRTVALVRSRTPAGAALSSVVIERLLGVLALAALLIAGLAVSSSTPVELLRSLEWNISAQYVWLGMAGVTVMAAVVLTLALHSSKLQALINDAFVLLRGFSGRPRTLLTAIGASLAVQALYVLTWMLLAWGVRLGLDAGAFLIYVPLISIAAMLPVSLAGLGLREGAWALLLAPLGISTATAFSFSLLYYVAGLAIGVIGAGFFFTSGLRTELETGIDDIRSHRGAIEPAGV